MKLRVQVLGICALIASAAIAATTHAAGVDVGAQRRIAAAVTLPPPTLNTGQGAVSLWVRPVWSTDDTRSHVIFTLPLSGSDAGYMALSLGWWEPGGTGLLYFVLSNRDELHCSSPGDFPYPLLTPGLWTHIAASWSQSEDRRLHLYVDGREICARPMRRGMQRRPAGPLYLGSDAGATDRRARAAGFDIRGLQFFSRSLSATVVADAYASRADEAVPTWLQAALQRIPSEPGAAAPRVMLEEDAGWIGPRAAIDRLVARLSAAHIDTFVPCVWSGETALFATRSLPLHPKYAAQRTTNYDPLQYLIVAAGRAGIRVLLWFDVARRAAGRWPEEFTAGAPAGAFDLHSAGFQQFMAAVIGSAVADYRPQGVMLDYIRNLGDCSSLACQRDYRALYGRELAADLRRRLAGESVPDLVQWQTRALRATLTAIAGQARAAVPGVDIVACTMPFDAERTEQGVDVEDWLQRGLVDHVYYMAYDEPLQLARVTAAWRRLGASHLTVVMRNYDLTDGVARPRGGAELAGLLRLAAFLWPGSGVAFYHLPHFNDDQAVALAARMPAGS